MLAHVSPVFVRVRSLRACGLVTAFTLFDTPIGRCSAAWTERGLVWVGLPDADDDASRARIVHRHPGATELRARGEAKVAIDAMRAHLSGKLDRLDGVRLDETGL